ncbi:signal peptidase I [Anaerovorax odorimutans]|uniref:Signal peptidase I n=1 Tax=Anaerovorax odorimutans TaxID=109327 RepID=A0ABT1RK47_9FIRM|nr:signal peptidase I [Anaerovorax odorimutans]MCQ4635336.1 signal peptidase I [Anaerovorax odorimutans]
MAIKLYRILETILIFLAMFIVLALGGMRLFGNMSPYIVLSGSMEPVVPAGSLCFVDKKSTEIEVGDIVAFSKGRLPVAHRIIAEKDGVYRTKGDNNLTADTAPVKKAEIIGKTIFSIPKAGYAAAFLKSARGMVLTTILLAGFIATGRVLSKRKKHKEVRYGED